MPELIPIVAKEDIDQRVASIARRISMDYKDKELVLIGVLKGAFIFLSDLARYLPIPAKIDFIGASSYGSGTESSGTIKITKEIGIDIKDKDVLLVEDIVDTGLTLSCLVDYLKSFGPATIRTCALLDKHERRKTKVEVDYVCLSIAEGFLVGYGLDCDEQYRNLPAIYHLKF